MTDIPPSTLRTPGALVAAGLVPESGRTAIEAVAARYAVAITPAMADLIDPDAPDDPVGRQFVPDAAELRAAPGEDADPIGDGTHAPVPGIVHRYPDRVLLKPLHACAVYCRFCFRREAVGPGGEGALSAAALARALDYIAARPAIWEVVVTGGDPLILSVRRLRDLTRRLGAIPHVRVIRFHTRVPVVSPERVTPGLVAALRAGAGGQAVFVVLHANHAREMTLAARAACGRLVDAGIPLLSQSVLLRGVNDSPEALEGLMRALVEARVKPYYLHHPDLAPGTGHFRLPVAEGQALVETLRGRVSGLCQPAYVLDIPGGHGKAPLTPCAAEAPDAEGRHRVRDWRGGLHLYPPEGVPPPRGRDAG
ncbi:lysine-2,3-aminomutase-like protein [Rubellimicrobium sp. CFH 75288]|uniref:lysine-2,3-aminomutase-like protein n=1 Tax=Rubellimicrobium sp. CFH 75288 TaxID=2697034 RepID=UPI001412E2EB|nr:lysine-2,3-aminomutase-like protein [Rubellimicrobium sp. CFH 75288]NAZ36479.1 lysine-2,3-aminomutase-like protein [Rubellimicrobium sp. CFH 75288]